MKNNAVSLSFGYLVTKSRDREDGIRELLGIDLFEISIVPAPANPETRVLSMKSATETTDVDPDWEFRSMKKRWDEAWRKRDEEARRDRELEEMVTEITARTEREEAKAARAARPIMVKTFRV
jgi:hypothetical protein